MRWCTAVLRPRPQTVALPLSARWPSSDSYGPFATRTFLRQCSPNLCVIRIRFIYGAWSMGKCSNRNAAESQAFEEHRMPGKMNLHPLYIQVHPRDTVATV